MTMGRLDGKVAIVTGGGAGFGAEISRRFAAEGARVLVCDINPDGGQRVAAENASSMTFHQTDVTKAADWKAAVDAAVQKYGHVDILVNNAGTTYKNKPTVEVTEEEWEKVFNVNVKSIFLGSNAFVPSVIDRGQGGVMINIASVGATRPRPGLVWYNASKGAVWNATKGLAAEYGPHGIRVNSVCPLLSGTALFESFAGVPPTPENMQKFLFNVPMGRLCEPQDVAGVCTFLASDDAKFVTGINMEVDGGRCI